MMIRALVPSLAIAAALAAAGCGFGELSPEGKVAKTADDYLRALAAGNAGAACAQLAAETRTALGRPCRDETHAIATRLCREALVAAADAGVRLDLDGDRGVAEIRNVPGARLELTRVGDRWRITAGHRLPALAKEKS